MLAVGIAALSGPCGAAVDDHRGVRPNVVVVLTDDLGYGDIGCYGNEVVQTPHLDRFCRRGVAADRLLRGVGELFPRANRVDDRPHAVPRGRLQLDSVQFPDACAAIGGDDCENSCRTPGMRRATLANGI